MTRLNVKTIQSLTPHLYSTPVKIVRLKSQKTIALCCFQMAWMKTGDKNRRREARRAGWCVMLQSALSLIGVLMPPSANHLSSIMQPEVAPSLFGTGG